MPASKQPVPIPFPLSSFPGQNPQESSGRLINAYVEPLGEDKGKFKWIRSAGLSQLAVTTQSGYRGGLTVKNLAIECWSDNASTVDAGGDVTVIGPFPGTKPVSIAQNQASPTPDVVAVDLDNGAFVLQSAAVVAATATATIGGTTFTSGDVVTLVFLNAFLSPPFPISIVHTLGASETAITVAAALNTAINANATLTANHVSSTVAGAVLTISQLGSAGNQTSLLAAVGPGTETVTFVPASGDLTGGQGTPGAFSGVPTLFNGNGVLPQPSSVAFQDGYLFFTIGDGQVFATGINTLTMNALTFVTIQAKADVQLLRGIAFSGLMLFFTTGSCEVWQDTANPPPNFPYSRIAVLEIGLAQPTAIAGFETGFSELLWVAQDFGVHWMTASQLSQISVSPPDLDRLIEAQIRAGNILTAGVYIISKKKFWVLSSPDWTWEFNLQTHKWSERQSLSAGVYGRWRAVGGHPAFNKWLVGDTESGSLLFADDTNATENGSPMLWRLESALVKNFPSQVRVARADFDFVVGVGQAVGNISTAVVGAVASPLGGLVRLQVVSTAQMITGDVASVTGVLGTTEANGNFSINVIDASHIDLQATVFVNAYTSGGIVTDLTTTPNQQNPTVAISMSRDGGLRFGNPLQRPLGAQSAVLRNQVFVTRQGYTGTMGARWRLDVTDNVFVSLLGGTMDAEIRPPGV